jgi:transposase
MAEGTWVGLDVHARKTVAGVLDASTGEVRSFPAPTSPAETVEWLQQLPAPVRVAYEAAPTGYGVARASAGAGIACTVAAPSKIPRATGDRVENRPSQRGAASEAAAAWRVGGGAGVGAARGGGAGRCVHARTHVES